MNITNSFKQGAEKFGESWLACVIAMVQGNLLVLTTGHAIVAAKTGIIAALVIFFSTLVVKDINKWVLVFLTGVATMIADLITHPSNFGSAWTEAAVTGLGAMILAIVFEKLFK
jgi:hypothetical protein